LEEREGHLVYWKDERGEGDQMRFEGLEERVAFGVLVR